jgi:hypothetical protein
MSGNVGEPTATVVGLRCVRGYLVLLASAKRDRTQNPIGVRPQRSKRYEKTSAKTTIRKRSVTSRAAAARRAAFLVKRVITATAEVRPGGLTDLPAGACDWAAQPPSNLVYTGNNFPGA